MTRLESDAQFDSLLATFLGWDADQVAGAPDAEEMTRRLTASLRIGPRQRRVPYRPVVLAAALVGLLAIALVSAAILAGRPAPHSDLVVPDPEAACALDRVDPLTGVHRSLVPPLPDCGLDGVDWVADQLSASADGRRIAYSVVRERACPDCPGRAAAWLLEVWLLDTVTGGSTKIDDCGDVRCFMFPAVSPDGRRLAISRGSYPPVPDVVDTISIIDLDSGARVASRPYAGVNPRWSPDGSTLAFTALDCADPPTCDRHYARIEAMSADGSRTWTVFEDPTQSASYPDWTPDGTHLRFGTVDAQGGGSQMTLHQAAADGTGNVVLGTLPVDSAPLAWSPDGSRLAWLRIGGRIEADSVVELWVGAWDGQNATRLLMFGDGNAGGTGPLWSPDGRLLAFGYTLGENSDGATYVVGADGTGQHQVASVAGPVAWPLGTPFSLPPSSR